MSDRLSQLSQSGVSIWLDDLSRARLNSGDLARKIREDDVVGVTTNPAIFQAAISGAADYAAPIAELASSGASPEEVIKRLTTDDVREACDLFHDVYERTGGYDGRVSIEVDPRLARRTAETLEQAGELWATVDRPNVMIKIPATQEGLRPIAETLAAGISVNVTLIFSLTRYREVINAYMLGLEQALENGKDLSTIHSVASFFVSRVDTEIDARLEAAGGDAVQLKGKAGLANARLAYEVFEEMFSSQRWARLEAHGANVQRPLWASTGVKDPALPDTLYVTGLVAPNTVNTMPEATLNAVADHGEITGNTIVPNYSEANKVLDAISVHVSYPEVVEKLEVEGLSKFDVSWEELLQTVREALEQAK